MVLFILITIVILFTIMIALLLSGKDRGVSPEEKLTDDVKEIFDDK